MGRNPLFVFRDRKIADKILMNNHITIISIPWATMFIKLIHSETHRKDPLKMGAKDLYICGNKLNKIN